ncbi:MULTISPECIES: YeeE/YedE family protein [Haloarcula]|uniref:YeeE/YedE family protein n=1 Tax=Haloarcula TaxID=2237 RepID=UPI0023EB0D7F|nr:YeeE/YedE thiosulfate transporter family protein [Halomicroarcula sp. XH51]
MTALAQVAFAPELFPNGVVQYLVGGFFVGLGISVIYLGSGIIAGNSTFLETSLSYVSKLPRFNLPRFVQSRDWRVLFTVSIVLGAVGYKALFDPTVFVTEVQWWRLLGGGVLVGVGTRIGKGCTAGHGVCGVGSVSRTSIANVALFLGTAILVALGVAALGVTP